MSAIDADGVCVNVLAAPVPDSTKSRQAWNQWLVATRGTTVTPMIYEYGMAIASAKDRDKFMKACILPEETNRAGAAAESSVRDVVADLRQKWDPTYQLRPDTD
ncbi:uncharacterized protein PITG_17209 [Phytophthora infestans T30-4]|uniref:Uncharacterized protein n=1 Tax=Phytophthora infestans (strain T30-4) TaxID=403677 RepID=D0NV96_PHYIT|nr:uncharacterized protein PITG_17209 [Phytophthora infestans T30-4]EEY66568.1 conserved hypothetical protein [Phytophthora infestans T30-4]|eukprot:XP_002897087.1 conserved hypothetical protein [Phytophthora infestans T30-4]